MNSIVVEIATSASKEFKRILWGLMLASLALPFTSCSEPGVATTTKQGFTKARVSIIEEALYAFRSDVGRLPYTEEGLSALIAPPNERVNWHGLYTDRNRPLKDGWQRDFIYYYPSKIGGGDFDLYSLGPNGIDELGEGGDISNQVK
jgi:type II secretion system protein G